MYAQSHASNTALERAATIRKQAAEIEDLKIENAKLRGNENILRVALSNLYGQHGQSVDDQINHASKHLSEV